MSEEQFDAATVAALGYDVYRRIGPPHGEPFYDGKGRGGRGPMNAQRIIDAYALPVLYGAPPQGLVQVNIHAIAALHDRDAIPRQTRAAWRRATHHAFPDLIPEGADQPGRAAFEGVPAEAEVREAHVGERGRRIVNADLRQVQNPIPARRV